MFVWAKVPGHFDTSLEFVKELFEQTGVLVTPGSAFGLREKDMSGWPWSRMRRQSTGR